MSRSLFLSPHNDDSVLFGSFTLLREKPHVVTCFRSQVQYDRLGITAAVREAEDHEAFRALSWDITWEQWPFLDSGAGAGMAEMMRELAACGYDRVYAPASEDGGHDQHSFVGELAVAFFGERVTRYLTYTRGGGKSEGQQVVYEPEWVTRKLRAMACYRSQIETPGAGCTEHFVRDLREYYAA